MSLHGKVLEQFLLDLRTNLEDKGFDSNYKLIRRHLRLYRFDDHPIPYFLSIHESLCGFWEISPGWEEVAHLFCPSESKKWAVVFLQKSNGEDHPFGFLMTSDNFIKMISGFSINRMGRIRIHEKDLPSKDRFNDWKSFFGLLNRSRLKDNSDGCYDRHLGRWCKVKS